MTRKSRLKNRVVRWAGMRARCGNATGRDDDTFGLGYFYTDIEETRVGNVFDIDDHSQGFEAFYNLAVAKSVFLSADIQVLDPAESNVDTAVVVATRLKIAF